VSGCAWNKRGMRAQHFWGFPLYCQLDGKRLLSNASTVVENQIFGAGVTKIF